MARCATIERNTKETKIRLTLELDGTGKADIHTGIGFFDHMLNSFARHGFFDLDLTVDGDLEVESVPGEVYPTLADIVIDQGTGTDVNAAGNDAAGMEAGADVAGNTNAGTSASGAQNASETSTPHGGNAGASADAAPAAAVVQIPSDAVKYVVQEGETLYGICIERYHSMAQIPQICAWNGLADENHISVGQELYLPAK